MIYLEEWQYDSDVLIFQYHNVSQTDRNMTEKCSLSIIFLFIVHQIDRHCSIVVIRHYEFNIASTLSGPNIPNPIIIFIYYHALHNESTINSMLRSSRPTEFILLNLSKYLRMFKATTLLIVLWFKFSANQTFINCT